MNVEGTMKHLAELWLLSLEKYEIKQTLADPLFKTSDLNIRTNRVKLS